MAENKRNNSLSSTRKDYSAKRVYIRLNIDSLANSVSSTPVNSRKYSADLSSTFNDETSNEVQANSFQSPIKRIMPRGKPPLSPNLYSKFESPQKNPSKNIRCRELSKAFVLSKQKHMLKIQNENLKFGIKIT